MRAAAQEDIMAAKQKDLWANIASIHVAETAANTFNKQKLETSISVFDKMAWVINRLEYDVYNISHTNYPTEASYGNVALCSDGTVSSLPAGVMSSDARVLHGFRITPAWVAAAPASGQFLIWPYVVDFSTLPNGGLLCPATALHLACQGSGLAGIMSVRLRIYYTNLTLSTDEYWELIESRRMLTA